MITIHGLPPIMDSKSDNKFLNESSTTPVQVGHAVRFRQSQFKYLRAISVELPAFYPQPPGLRISELLEE